MINRFYCFSLGKVDEWKSLLDIHVLGLTICTREAVKSMKEKGIDDGHVINIGSLTGQKVPQGLDHVNFYSATKFAVKALTEATRNELHAVGKNFRVTELVPGVTETDIFSRSLGPQAAKEFCSRFRCLQPDDIAESVVYILSAPPHVQITMLIIDTIEPFP